MARPCCAYRSRKWIWRESALTGATAVSHEVVHPCSCECLRGGVERGAALGMPQVPEGGEAEAHP